MPKPLQPFGRKSSGEDPTQSRARQDTNTTGWAARRGELLLPLIFERRVSGSKNWRERELGIAIDKCIRGEAGGIVVDEQSRLSRGDMLATADVWTTLQRHEIRLVCTEEGLDTAERDCELDFGLKALLAREQWKQYQRRAHASKRFAVLELGIHIGPAPTGYEREQGSRKPLARHKNWRAIRKAFELRATGVSYGEVARFLDERWSGGPSGRGHWSRYQVRRLLTNRVYLGEARGGGFAKADAHPAIVDSATFHVVMGLEQDPERPAPPHALAMLAGVVICGACGYNMRRSSSNLARWHYYRCHGKHSAAPECTARASASVPALDALVLEHAIGELERTDVAVEEAPVDTSEIRARLAAVEATRAPFEDPGYVARLGLAAADRALAKVDADIAKVQRELAEATIAAGGVDLEQRLASAEILRSGTDDERRELLGNMLEGIVVSRAPRGVALVDRVRLVWRGERLPVARPRRGRPEVSPGMASPENGAGSR